MIATNGQRLFRRHSLAKQELLHSDAPGLVKMNAIEATITNAIDINTLGGGQCA